MANLTSTEDSLAQKWVRRPSKVLTGQSVVTLIAAMFVSLPLAPSTQLGLPS